MTPSQIAAELRTYSEDTTAERRSKLGTMLAKRRARCLTPERRAEIARAAAEARWAKKAS